MDKTFWKIYHPIWQNDKFIKFVMSTSRGWHCTLKLLIQSSHKHYNRLTILSSLCFHSVLIIMIVTNPPSWLLLRLITPAMQGSRMPAVPRRCRTEQLHCKWPTQVSGAVITYIFLLEHERCPFSLSDSQLEASLSPCLGDFHGNAQPFGNTDPLPNSRGGRLNWLPLGLLGEVCVRQNRTNR